jgi:hypothetical protein
VDEGLHVVHQGTHAPVPGLASRAERKGDHVSRPLYVTLGLTVADDADDEAVAEFVFDLVGDGGGVPDAIPYETTNDYDWKRGPER